MGPLSKVEMRHNILSESPLTLTLTLTLILTIPYLSSYITRLTESILRIRAYLRKECELKGENA